MTPALRMALAGTVFLFMLPAHAKEGRTLTDPEWLAKFHAALDAGEVNVAGVSVQGRIGLCTTKGDAAPSRIASTAYLERND